MKITKNAWDSNIINSNGKYLSVNWDASGGGAFAIIPLNEYGKSPDKVPLFRGHTAPVLDTAFNPFNEQQIASSSDDGKICIWNIPENYSFNKPVEGDEVRDITEPLIVLTGHSRKVGHIEFHPCAENVLASSSMDYTVRIWNVTTGKDLITLPHKDMVTSFSFNYNGSLLATTSRDKKLRIWDIRSGKIISEGPGHTGAKPSRVVWLGNTDRIATTGFSRLSDRQVGIWDIKDIEKGPIDGFMVIDSSSGVLIPVFDPSNSILYLAGKGDGNIRYYEYENDFLHELSQYSSTDPQRGFAVTPKRSVNVKENEVLRSFKTVNDHLIEPISFIVPRRSELFQDDIYPDCPSYKPALTAEEWFNGKEVNGPLLMSMVSLYEGSEPLIRNSEPATSISEKVEEAKKTVEETKKAAEETKKTAEETKKAPEVSKNKEEEASKKEESSNPVNRNITESPKNVDEAMKSSEKVSKLLDKVNDLSESEDEQRSNESANKFDDDGWEEVKSSEGISAREVSPQKIEVKESQDPIIEKKEESVGKDAFSTINAAPATSLSVTKPEEEDSKDKPIVKATNAPTLKATVEKLANLVDQLEGQISILTKSNLEKDVRLETLEKKIEDLIQK